VDIAPDARMGLVELSVSDLDRSLEYWQDAVGLRILSRDNGTAELGADTPLVRFVEEQGARPADGFTGLYHVALLVPDRPSLGRFLGHTVREQIPLEGLSDHDVSEAIYLRDPDRHGIEVYADRPREQWEGRVFERLTTRPLDAASVLAEAGDARFGGLPDGTTVGHVHLRVRDVDEAIGFYRDVLGMGLMAQLGDTAAFFSAGGYHHHVGANTWETRGATPAPVGTARLHHVTIVLPDEAERNRLAAAVGAVEEREDGLLVRDASGNGVLLAAAY
jgi:catechol 2,3-dioxygenase